MSDTFRALCAELLDWLDCGIAACRIRVSPAAMRARAALAATPPRPVPVAEGLNDAQLEERARAFTDEPVEVAAFICGARWAEYKLKPGPAHAIPLPQEDIDV